MNYIYLILGVLLVIIILCIIYSHYKEDINEYIILDKLKNIKNGNLKLINTDGKLIFESNPNKKSKYNAVIKVNDPNKFYSKIINDGEIGFGEAYVENVWETNDIFAVAMILVANAKYLQTNIPLYSTYKSITGDYENIQHHYDLGNDFYDTFLTDDLKAYSCGFFLCPNDTLNSAQHNKVNKVIQKLNVKPNQKVIDIGCGWGRIANYIQKKTNCKMSGVTISKQQIKYINDNFPNINAKLKHYEELDTNSKFSQSDLCDRIYSIGMFEHVRCSNYPIFFQKMYNLLYPGGRMVLHTISKIDNDVHCNETATQSFIAKHIFPGGQIPKHEWIIDNATKVGFKIIHVEIFGGLHYAKTLREWRKNLMNNKEKLLKKYTLENIRTYEYYFAICEALFLNDNLQLSQYVFDKVDDLSDVTHSAYNCDQINQKK